MLRSPIALAEAKAYNTSENLLNESVKSYVLCIDRKKLLKKVYNNKMNSVKL